MGSGWKTRHFRKSRNSVDASTFMLENLSYRGPRFVVVSYTQPGQRHFLSYMQRGQRLAPFVAGGPLQTLSRGLAMPLHGLQPNGAGAARQMVQASRYIFSFSNRGSMMISQLGANILNLASPLGPVALWPPPRAAERSLYASAAACRATRRGRSRRSRIGRC